MGKYILADNQELTRLALISLIKQDEENTLYVATDKAGLVELLKEHEDAIVLLDFTLFDFADADQLLIVGERFALSQWILISDELTPVFIRQVIYASHQFSIVFKDGPLNEVREALKRGYLSQVMGLKVNSFNTLVDRAKRQIASGDWKGYLYESLYGLYASVPPDWHIRDEAEAKRYFQLFSSMTGANPQPEVASMLGYADAVIETQANVFVFEFKYRRSAKAAIRQIRDRGYADKWIGGERPVTLIGINCNPKKRNIDIPAVEPA